MSDDRFDLDIDARLRAAGARFRAADTIVLDAAARDDAVDRDVVTVIPVPPPHRRRRATWIAAASAAAVVAALAVGVAGYVVGTRHPTNPAGTASQLFGPTWNGTTVTASGGRAQTASGVQLTFADGRLSGSDGCNHISGAVTLQGNVLVVGTLTSTFVVCPHGPSDLVERILAGRVTYSVSGHVLILAARGVGTLRLTSLAPGQDTLVGTWQLTGTATTRQSTGPASGSASSAVGTEVLTLAADGQLTIKHRCDTEKTSYSLDGQRIRFGRLRVVLALPCVSVPDENTEQSQDDFVDSVLTGAARWSISDDQLTLVNGANTAVFAGTHAAALLTTTAWSLRTITQGSGPARTPGTAITIGFSPGQAACSCEAQSTTTTSGATLTFGSWTVSPTTYQDARIATQLHFLFTDLLLGATRWSIDNGVLTIDAAGIGSITLVAHS